jgi:hypothetical protein
MERGRRRAPSKDANKELDVTSNLTGTNFTWVDTVVQLKFIIGSGGAINSRPAAIVGGYWAIGDGGGGTFYWDT